MSDKEGESTSANPMGVLKEDPIQVLFEVKTEFAFTHEKKLAYTSWIADHHKDCNYSSYSELCDVYQVISIPIEHTNVVLTDLSNCIYTKCGEIYASRLDICDSYIGQYGNSSLADPPFVMALTVWTSKTAFDKWHFVNDHRINYQVEDILPGCHESHLNVLDIFHSVALEACHKINNKYTVAKFEVPYGRKVIPRMKYTVSYRGSNLYETDELTLNQTVLVDHDNPIDPVCDEYNSRGACAALYVFYPESSVVDPNLKKAQIQID
jgi:hypothetical protein